MAISTPIKVGIATAIVVMIIVAGAGVLAWNRAKPPVVGDDEVTPEPTTAPAIASRPAGAPLFTLSPKTTVITSPLHEDGTPDYIAASNALLSQGVTPENNVFVAWLAVIGTGNGMLSESTAAETLSMAGASASDARWVGFYKYCDEQGHPDHGSEAQVDDIQKAERGPWSDKDLPVLAAYLHDHGDALNAGEKAWSRPRYWLPSVANDHRSMTNVLLPALSPARDLAKALLARSMQRLAARDVDGCCADILGAGRVAALLSTGQSIIERLVAYAIQNEIALTLAGASSTETLTIEQCAALSRVAEKLPPVQDLHCSIDVFERWSRLDMVLRLATGHADEMTKGMDTSIARGLAMVEPDGVDWDTVMIGFNTSTDDALNAVGHPLLEELQGAQKKMMLARAGGASRAALRDLTPREGETREQYTHRVSAALEVAVAPDLGRAEELRRAAGMQLAMGRAMVELAKYRAVERHWPASTAEWNAGHGVALPIDIYVAGGATPVLYMLNPSGPTLYSVGRNRQDDHGVRDNARHDDIAVGAPVPTR